MNTSSIGDLAQSYMLRNRNAAIKQDISRLTEELTTGRTSDVRSLLVGNYAFLTDVERKTEVLSAFAVATTEASHFTGAMQLTLENYRTQSEGLSSSLLSAGSGSSGIPPSDMAQEARTTFGSMIEKLNATFAGRQLFSGNTTNQPPMASADAILADLTVAISAATTPADMMAQATAWFDDPAGFRASAYQGSADPMAPFKLSLEEDVTLDLRADDPSFLPTLRGAAVAALAEDATFGLQLTEQKELFSLAGNDMLLGDDNTIALQSRLGFAEARIETISARNAAELTSLTMAKNALLEVDPFEAATRLEEAQFQLQSLYSVTVRMSQLSLVNYL